MGDGGVPVKTVDPWFCPIETRQPPVDCMAKEPVEIVPTIEYLFLLQDKDPRPKRYQI